MTMGEMRILSHQTSMYSRIVGKDARFVGKMPAPTRGFFQALRPRPSIACPEKASLARSFGPAALQPPRVERDRSLLRPIAAPGASGRPRDSKSQRQGNRRSARHQPCHCSHTHLQDEVPVGGGRSGRAGVPRLLDVSPPDRAQAIPVDRPRPALNAHSPHC